MRRRTAALALYVVTSLALGCATESQLAEKVIGASPAPDSGFLEKPERMAPHRARDPFDRSWVSENLDWASYDELYVAPVDTTHVLEQSLWDKVNVRQHAVKDDIRTLGSELRKRIVQAFHDDPKHHFEIVDDRKAIAYAEYRAGRAVPLLHAYAVVTPSAAGLETTPAHDAEAGDYALALVRRV